MMFYVDDHLHMSTTAIYLHKHLGEDFSGLDIFFKPMYLESGDCLTISGYW